MEKTEVRTVIKGKFGFILSPKGVREKINLIANENEEKMSLKPNILVKAIPVCEKPTYILYNCEAIEKSRMFFIVTFPSNKNLLPVITCKWNGQFLLSPFDEEIKISSKEFFGRTELYFEISTIHDLRWHSLKGTKRGNFYQIILIKEGVENTVLKLLNLKSSEELSVPVSF